MNPFWWYAPAIWLLVGIAWVLSVLTEPVKMTPSIRVAIVVCVLGWPIAAPLNWYMGRLRRRRAE